MMKTSLAVLALSIAACGGAPTTATQRENLEQSAQATLAKMQTRDPTLRGILEDAPAYLVFPSVGKGGALVGGAFGRGILYEDGQATGYVELSQASLGAQLGGQTFAQLIVVRDEATVQKIKAGKFDLGAGVSAIALTAGAAGATSLDADTSVFVMPIGGLMVDVSVSGQRLRVFPYDLVGDQAG